MPLILALNLLGATAFGVVVGWITYGSMRRAKRNGLTDITTIIGALGGAAVTKLFPLESGLFGAYCLGLTVGFFGYLRYAGRPGAPEWLGENPSSSTRPQAEEAPQKGLGPLPPTAG